MSRATKPRAEQLAVSVPLPIRQWIEAMLSEEAAKAEPVFTHKGEIEDLRLRVEQIEKYLEADDKYSLTRPKLIRMMKELGL